MSNRSPVQPPDRSLSQMDPRCNTNLYQKLIRLCEGVKVDAVRGKAPGQSGFPAGRAVGTSSRGPMALGCGGLGHVDST